MNYFPRALVEIGMLFEDYGKPADGPLFSPNIDLLASGGSNPTAKRLVEPIQATCAVKHATLERANLRTADALTVTIPYRDMPFDPEVVRGAYVGYYLGTVQDPTGRSQPELTQEWRRAISPPGNSIGETNLRFAGISDDWKTEHKKDGHWITISARDFTALLLDALWPQNKRIDLHGNLLEVVSRIANGVNYGISFTVSLDPRDHISSSDIPRPLQDFNLPGPLSLQHLVDGGTITAENEIKAEDGMPTIHKEGLTYWDIITTICTAEGFVPILGGPRGQTIFLRRTSDIYTTPTDEKEKKVMVWGRNIEDITIARKLGRIKSPVILVTGYAPGNTTKNGHLIYATYPKDALDKLVESQITGQAMGLKPTFVDPRGNDYRVEIQPYHFPHVRSKKAAQRAAEALYHEVGRQPIQGTLTTKDLSAWHEDPLEDGNSVPDLLSLHAGDTISLEVLPEDLTAPQGAEVLSRLRARPDTEIVTYLTDLGYDDDVALKLAEAVKSPFFTTTYKVRTVKYDYDTETGLNLTIEFSNYIEQRNP